MTTNIIALNCHNDYVQSIYNNGRQKYAITPTLYGTRQGLVVEYAKASSAIKFQV
jgi:hypothetical protein